MEQEDFGGLVSRGPFTTVVSEADPIISRHAIHWVLSRESYSSNRRKDIDGWLLAGETIDTCMYHFPAGEEPGKAIVAFRGSQTLDDIKADVQLSRPGGNGCNFDKLMGASKMIEDFILDNPDVPIQLTGHSLGGAIARCAGQKHGLGIVTFNSAAPPTNPVYTGPNEVDYHIVFDLISAWQNPNTVRIDKGYKPPSDWFPLKFIRGLNSLLESHSIDNFSNQKKGVITTSEYENNLMQTWYKKLPRFIKILFDRYINSNKLPPIP